MSKGSSKLEYCHYTPVCDLVKIGVYRTDNADLIACLQDEVVSTRVQKLL